MENRDYIVVNSFSDKPFGGNPAGIFIQSDGLDQTTMQQIAKQMNLVECTFIFKSMSKDYDYFFRYFTPTKEVPIAGHPTIAAVLALVENKQIDIAKKDTLKIKTKAGVKQLNIKSTSTGPIVIMEQQEPKFQDIIKDRGEIAQVFGIDEDDIIQDLPIQPVNTGLGHIIFGVKSLSVLMSIKRNIKPLSDLCSKFGVSEAQIFTFETEDKNNTIHTRNICPREGIEDPACGVGNGALGAYLMKHHYLKENKILIKAEQGNIIGMPSIIEIYAERLDDQINVSIGGQGRVMRKGTFFL